MHFYTRESWESIVPKSAECYDLNLPDHQWNYVEFHFQGYYFQVHINDKSSKKNANKYFMLCLKIENAIRLLSLHPKSTLTLFVPDWITRGEPGLYEVAKIYVSSDPELKTFIVECTNKKMYAMNLDPEPRKITLSNVHKFMVWEKPK